jgi:ribosome modulation factor
MDNTTKAYRQGYSAYLQGLLLQSNPYRPEGANAKQWIEGFNAAYHDDRKYD